MANYLDSLQTFTNAAILKIAEQRRLLRIARAAGEGGYEYIDNIIAWNQWVTGANDTNQDETLRLRLLTLLVDNAQLNTNVPVDIINLYQPFIFYTGSGPVLWGGIGGDIEDQLDLIAKFNTYLPLSAGSTRLMTGTIFFGEDELGIDTFNEGDTLNIGFSAGVIQFGADSEARFNLITAGNWQGTAIAPAYGGLGVQVLAGQAGKAVVVNGAGTGYQLATLAGGDVVGPASATDNAIARFDGTTGKLIQTSPVNIGDLGQISGARDITFNGSTSGFVNISVPAVAGSSVQTLQAATGTVALLQNNLGAFASTTSAQLLAKISDATGSGLLVFNDAPTFIAPVLGDATGTSLSVSGALTTGVDSATAGLLTFRNSSNSFTQTFRGTEVSADIIYDLPRTEPSAGQYLSATAPTLGEVTLSWETFTALTNPMSTLGDIIYGGALGVATSRAGNTTTTRKFLRSTGAAGLATAPDWDTLVAGDIPTIAQSQVSGLVTALTNKLGTGLTDGYMFVGNAANAAVGVAMSQDGTLDNTGALTIADEAITFAKMQNITFQTLMGRWSAGDGPPQEISIGSGLSLSGAGVLSASGGSGSPGGSTTQLQYNNAGAFGGISGATTNGTTVTFASGGLLGTNVTAATSGGFTIINNAAGNVALFGAGSGVGVSLYGGVNIAQASADYWGFAGGTGTITMTATGSSTDINVSIVPKGAGALNIGGGATAAELRFLEPSGSGTNYTGFKAPALAGNVMYTLPTTDGTSGQVLQTNGSGTLSWVTGGGGGISLAAIGSTPNGNGATLTGSVLNLEPASASFGGVVTTSPQTFAGVKTFAATNTIFTTTTATQDGIIIEALASGSTSRRLTITNASLAASRTHTIPDGGANANFLLSQGNQTMVGSQTINFPGSTTVASLNFGGATQNWINFGTTGLGTPLLTAAKSAGSKIVLLNSANGTIGDYAIGIASGELWLSSSTNSVSTNISFYGGTTKMGYFGGTGLTLPAASTTTSPTINFIGTSPWINFGTSGLNPPALTTRSTGTKIVLFDTISGSLTDYAIGFNTNELWLSCSNNTNTSVSFYGGTTKLAQFGNGARLVISAGTATANTAPLKFTSGTNLTTPENGAMEYNGTNLFFTRTGAVREGVLTQSAVTTEVVVSDTTVTVNIGGTTYKLLARA